MSQPKIFCLCSDLVTSDCREKFVTTFQSSCLFWMPAQAVNFLLVPAGLRVVYVASCSLLWVNILCLIKRGSASADNNSAAVTEE